VLDERADPDGTNHGIWPAYTINPALVASTVDGSVPSNVTNASLLNACK
jgi:hypothetical protein